jgi:uncharacterized protein YjbI with pentapeptide repeats
MKIAKPSDALILLGCQSRGGQPSLTVTVGYACERGASLLSEQDIWKWLAPRFPDEPFDLGLKRTRGVFAMAGSACAPGAVPVNGLTVGATVGALGKHLLVQGNRYWRHGATGWRASPPEPFVTQDIGLAHAYGAKDWPSNPYGRGRYADPSLAEGQALPNIELPGAPVLSPADAPPPATFGPLPQGSPDLARWLGRFDKAWERERLPWLPDDTDPRWFDRVPQDQCAQAYWRGDESWSATHMHPDLPEQSGRLPGLRPRLLVRYRDTPLEHREAPMDLDTVWLFPTDSRVIVLYRAELAVRYEDASDVAGLALFTEKLIDPPLSTAHYATLWRTERKSPVDRMAAAAAGAQAKARPPAAGAAERAAKAAGAQAQRAHVSQAVAAAHKTAVAESGPYWQALGMKDMAGKIPPFAMPAARAAASPLSPVTAATLKAQVKKSIDETQADVRTHLSRHGIDLDAVLARSRQHVPPSMDSLAMLATLPLSPGKKAALQTKIQAFTGQMQAVEKQAAAIRATAPSPPPPKKKAEAAAEEAPAADAAHPAGALPDGPRLRLTREELAARHRAGLPANWIELDGEDLSGLDLSGIDLSRSRLHACVLQGITLNGARLTEVQLEGCDLGQAQLKQTHWQRALLTNCNLRASQLDGADFSQARLKHCQFDRSRLTASSWREASIDKSSFEHANLERIQASHARFVACRLDSVNAAEGVFDRTRFDQCTLASACFDRTSLESACLTACQAVAAQFIGARLRGLRTLAGTDLQQAHLEGADMTRASLQNTNLGQASLRETCLDKAFIKECDFSATDAWHLVARHADFTGSRIANASWRGANLMQSRFARATLENVDLSGANLHGASTRTAIAQGIVLHQALLTRCRLVEEHA